MRERPLRTLVAKAGLDGHDRGAHVIARALGEAVLFGPGTPIAEIVAWVRPAP